MKPRKYNLTNNPVVSNGITLSPSTPPSRTLSRRFLRERPSKGPRFGRFGLYSPSLPWSSLSSPPRLRLFLPFRALSRFALRRSAV